VAEYKSTLNLEEYNLLQELEMELVQPATWRNTARLSELIDDEFEEFGSSGKRYRKQDILNSLPKENNVQCKLSHFEFKTLSKVCILVKYKSTSPVTVSLRSSVWVKNSGNWKILHHQATLIQNAV
jgi:hypothetical protein